MPRSETKTHTVHIPVVEVTLFEDRAQVMRRGTVELASGQNVFRVEGIAPVVSDRTVRAVLPNVSNGTRVSDIRVERELRHEIPESDDDRDEVRAKLREAKRDHRALVQRVSNSKRQLDSVEQATEKALKDIEMDVSWGHTKQEEWHEILRTLSDRETELLTDLLNLKDEIRDNTELRGDLENRSSVSDRPDRRTAAAAIIDIVSSEEKQTKIEISYVVPAACWRPIHSAHLNVDDSGSASVTFATDGCLWQNCGEDWTDINLQFSTQRPSLGFEPPLLGEDVLVSRERPEVVQVEARDEKVRTTGLGVATEISNELPGIDDGGIPLVLTADHTATIPSDGRPYRVKISEFSTDADVELATIAELSPCAITKVTMVNNGANPVLAGPVELLRDHGYVGKTPVLYVAPGERFALGFGPDPAIRVRRKVSEIEAKQSALSRFTTVEHGVTLLICNIGEETRKLLVTERVPVSEIEQVEIAFNDGESTPGAKPDENGFVEWSLELPPVARETVHLRYAVKKRRNVEG